MKLANESLKNSKDLFFSNFTSEAMGYDLLHALVICDFPKSAEVFFPKNPDLRYSEMFLVLDKLSCSGVYFKYQEYQNIIESGIKEIFESPLKIENNHKETYQLNDQLIEIAKSCKFASYSKFSDKEIGMMLEKMYDITRKSHANSLVTTWSIDSEDEIFSKKLMSIVENQIKISGSHLDKADIFSILTTKQKNSLQLIEELESWQIVEMINNNALAKNAILEIKDFTKIPVKVNSKIQKSMMRHFKKWRWMPFTYMGPAYNLDYYLTIWHGLVKEGHDSKNKIIEIKSRPEKIAVERAQIFNDLKIGNENQAIFNIAADIAFLKGYRKDALFYSCYVLASIYKEICKRKSLAVNQIYLMIQDEIVDMMLNNNMPDMPKVNKRNGRTLMHWKNGVLEFLHGNAIDAFLDSKKIRKLEIDFSVTELKGTTACSGYAKGIVRIVNNQTHMSKMKKGDILVSHTTYPALVPAMKLASAIVTEDGGITCHAAIVSRELKIPCITGIRTVTKVFKDGDNVEVDANKGIIKLLDSVDSIDSNDSNNKERFVSFAKDFGTTCIRNAIGVLGMNRYEFEFGIKSPEMAMLGEKGNLTYLVNSKAWEDIHYAFVSRAKADVYFIRGLIQKQLELGKLITDFTQSMYDSDIQEKSNEEIIDHLRKFEQMQSRSYTLGVIMAMLDFEHFSFIASTLRDYLKKNALSGYDEKYFQILTSPSETSFLLEQELDLYGVMIVHLSDKRLSKILVDSSISMIKKLIIIKQRFPLFYADLKTHTKKYYWLYYAYSGPIFTEVDFLKYIITNILQNKSPASEIIRIKQEKKDLIHKKENIIAELNPDPFNEEIMRMAGTVVWSKPRRKEFQSQSYCHIIEGVLKEVAKRLGLSRIQVTSATIAQLCDGLLAGSIDKKILDLQYDVNMIIYDVNIDENYPSGKYTILGGDVARKYISKYVKLGDKEKKSSANDMQLKGTCACPGDARGKVKIINVPADISKMNYGDILVSVATSPAIVPAMRIASAIVTDEGGLTCHASIVSRELNIPCIVGTKMATYVLRNGMEVQVDATKGIVTILDSDYDSSSGS